MKRIKSCIKSLIIYELSIIDNMIDILQGWLKYVFIMNCNHGKNSYLFSIYPIEAYIIPF